MRAMPDQASRSHGPNVMAHRDRLSEASSPRFAPH